MAAVMVQVVAVVAGSPYRRRKAAAEAEAVAGADADADDVAVPWRLFVLIESLAEG